MKAQDLRLGNFVIAKNEIIKIIEFRESFILGENDNCLIRCLPSQMKPIELTEKLLYKIGFCFGGVSGYGKHYVKTNGNDTLWCKIYESGNMSLTCNNNANLIQLHKVKFLHQLQNAYYLLTNQELDINL